MELSISFYDVASRKDLEERFWYLFEESDSSNIIRKLLGSLSDKELEDLVKEMDG